MAHVDLTGIGARARPCCGQSFPVLHPDHVLQHGWWLEVRTMPLDRLDPNGPPDPHLRTHDGLILCSFCPWCGAKFEAVTPPVG